MTTPYVPSTEPHVHKAYFLLAKPNPEIVGAGTDVGQNIIYWSEHEARRALPMQQYGVELAVKRGDLTDEVARATDWTLQVAHVAGLRPDAPAKMPRVQQADGQWCTGTWSVRDESRFYPFAGGFADEATLVEWLPFIFTWQRTVDAVDSTADIGRPELHEEFVGQSGITVSWSLLSFAPVYQEVLRKGRSAHHRSGRVLA